MNSRPAAARHLRDLARPRRVRDRIDWNYAQPLDVEALACGVQMSTGHLSCQFMPAFGESPYSSEGPTHPERDGACCVVATSASYERD